MRAPLPLGYLPICCKRQDDLRWVAAASGRRVVLSRLKAATAPPRDLKLFPLQLLPRR